VGKKQKFLILQQTVHEHVQLPVDFKEFRIIPGMEETSPCNLRKLVAEQTLHANDESVPVPISRDQRTLTIWYGEYAITSSIEKI
jgi:hypothetical protein